MYSSADILFLLALSPIHVGIGRSPGIVDLPIIRDNFGLPIIPGSSLKGALKSLCILSYEGEHTGERSICEQVFGPEPGSERENTWVSLVNILDAELLFYPARIVLSNNEVTYGYATSKYQLARLMDLIKDIDALNNCERLGDLYDALEEIYNDDNEEKSSSNISVNGLKINKYKIVKDDKIPGIIKNLFPEKTYEKLIQKIVVINDQEDFRAVVERGIIRQARIRLDRKKKTVIRGGLWTEEYISHAAVLYSPIIYREPHNHEYREPMQLVTNLLNDYKALFIGGKETIGKGLVRIIQASRTTS
ncbi:MAG: type III-B CRISPR module RAMP protein Cmr4 [Crenarchaeota archaeon]|nr:type III-B CRISPR module RAMP protein Cmr4 [Thermoproteota archaeon]